MRTLVDGDVEVLISRGQKGAKGKRIETFEATAEAEESCVEVNVALSGPKQVLKLPCMPRLPNNKDCPATAPIKVVPIQQHTQRC